MTYLDSSAQRARQASQRLREKLQTFRLGGKPPSASSRETTDIHRIISDSLHRAGLQGVGRARRESSPQWVDGASPGVFLEDSLETDWGSLEYKLYIPTLSSNSEASRPLIVMLHGCTQSPDDFAAGTQMNALAEKHGFLVLYPAQSVTANPNRCWSWFRRHDQVRGKGEPAKLAAVTRFIAGKHEIDERRIFVAGLSAGAAMANVLGRTYPELYAAVGSHSGLPYGAAEDVASAFRAMRGMGNASIRNTPHAEDRSLTAPKRTIVFHGDQDRTVNAANSATIADDALGTKRGTACWTTIDRSGHENGASFRRTLTKDEHGTVVVEHWSIAGAGHAWSGGDARGSYAATSGPRASQEMVRFFLTPELS